MPFDLFMPPEHRKVWNALQDHRGKTNAISQADLAARVDMEPRKVRSLIHQLVVELKRQVASGYGTRGQAGYYLPADQREALDAAQALKDHALAILKRASVLEGITVDMAISSLYRASKDGEK